MKAKEIFNKHLAPTSPMPVGLDIESAEGVYLADKSGKKYIDFIAGIGVLSVGHKHPKVVEAIKNQLDKHAHVMVYGEYLQDSVISLAEKLASLLPEQLNTSYFVNSGTEANEAAIKLAKRATGKHRIITFNKAYHGNTQGSMSVSDNEDKKRNFRPLIPGVEKIAFDSIEALAAITEQTAAVIIEPIQGDAGVRIPSEEFMIALRNKCTEVGTLLIFDEVQTGIGRTGKLFAFEHFNIIPDIITLAKGLGGGMPIGAFIASHKLMKLLSHNPMLGHITTFGGNPVCCASALATLNIIAEQFFLTQVEPKGRLIEELLVHTEIKAIRRKGLMLAIELKTEEKVNKLIEYCIANGVIIYWFLSTRNSFRISPPLTITQEEIKEACGVIKDGLDRL
ncbi:Acetylornithine aminotransferase (ACOAT) [hydrothermal vent metagenome]|uniref:Acetylornithine aminotransferase (ACOAT) n=1 Tax=hydrothermal vent metagenome TaxID=652676 RepID=A0A3B0V1T4_9ZZZZ